ncbi:MAG: carboxypeptidase-like regulatory domain-containing protein, partial [Gemmatimonadota bacterium]
QVEIHFDERISERPASGAMDDAVLVSPRTGSVRVRHRRQSLEVSMAGGFRPGVVYQITLLPVINDMFGNTIDDAYEFFFSTGPEFHPNVLAGLVSSRLTGEPVQGARVDAMPAGDTIPYSATTDDQGLFSLRYIPPGEFRVVAYEDLNRNRAPDFGEPRDSTVETVGPADTVVVLDLALLQPDTTPAAVASAEVVDSVSVRVTLSDYLDPARPLDGITASLSREDGGAAPAVIEILHAHALDALLAAVAAAAREQADREAGDPDVVRPPELPARPDEAPGRVAQPAEDAREAPALPSRDIGVRLDGALVPGVVYRIELFGVENINGVPGGGGETIFTAPEPLVEEPPGEEPEPGDPVQPDTVPPDPVPPRA